MIKLGSRTVRYLYLLLVTLLGCAETKMIGSTVGQSINSTMTGLSILYSKVFWHSKTTGGDVVVYKYFLLSYAEETVQLNLVN